MAFEGDLESLPITDIIQLLHATGKSGTLTLKGAKGESQLVFDAGYIVSANHVNNSMRIGRILVDLGALTREELDAALKTQARAGKDRAPLVAALLEAGKIQPPQAYKGLEILIELTIVEVLTWSRGTFSLDIDRTFVSDEYRYFPEKLKQKIQINTQSVLMDALRIYDERKRDGTLMDAEFFGPEPEPEDELLLSAEDLGLGDLDNLERKVPDPFLGLQDQRHEDGARHRLENALAGVRPEERERLVHYLEELPPTPAGSVLSAPLLYCDEPLLREVIGAACGTLLRCVVESEGELEAALAEGDAPMLLVAPLAQGDACESLLRRICVRYPALAVYLLLDGGQCRLLPRFMQTGIRGVLPRPQQDVSAEGFITETIACLETLRLQLRTQLRREGQRVAPHFLSCYREIAELATPPEVTFALLRFLASFLARAVTFVQLRGELVSEKGIGVSGPGSVTAVKLRFGLGEPSLLRDVVEGGALHFGDADATLRSACCAALGTPEDSKVLLLPVRSLGRVIAVLYGDCSPEAPEPPLDQLRILAQHAGLVIDNGLYRKRYAQHGRKG